MVYEMPVDPRPCWIWCHLVLPETGEAKGTDDLKHRLLSQSLVIVGLEPRDGCISSTAVKLLRIV